MEVAIGQIGAPAAPIEATASRDTVEPARGTDEAIVRSYFRDIPIMAEIARCESNFRHTVRDGSVLRGRVDPADTGIMQINRRYHEDQAVAMGLDLADIYHNMAYARYLYETQGVQPWSASAPCWRSEVAIKE